MHELPVLGATDWLRAHDQVSVALGVGATPTRRRLAKVVASKAPGRFPTLVHPGAWIGNRVVLGEGSIVCAGCLVTTDIRIGSFVIVNLDCTVSHDTVIEDFATIAPGVNISGNVHIGEGCDLGTGATLIQGITVGAWSILGAGAVVVRDLPANVTAVGIPAQVIKERPEGWYEGGP